MPTKREPLAQKPLVEAARRPLVEAARRNRVEEVGMGGSICAEMHKVLVARSTFS
jgi:hypothetical protein